MALGDPSTVGAYAAKTHFADLLARAEAGEKFTITKHGTPVARLMPMQRKTTPDERRAAIERWKQLSKGLSLGGLKIRDLVNEGRR